MKRKRGTVKLKNGKNGILEACDQDTCKVCIEWSKKGQIWKNFVFCPLHCYMCEYAGYPDEFKIIKNENSGTFVCGRCYKIYLERIKNILRLGY